MLKKYHKLVIRLAVLISLLINGISPVIALETKDDGIIHSYSSYSLSQEEIDEQLRKQIENEVSPCMDEYMYEYIDLGTDISKKSGYDLANNQPKTGVVFESGIGAIHWKDSSTVAATVSLSVGFSKGPGNITVGITPGTRVTSGVYEYSAFINNKQIGKYVKLYVAKDYEVHRYAVYRYNKYSGPSTKTFYKYEDKKAINVIYFDVRTVS